MLLWITLTSCQDDVELESFRIEFTEIAKATLNGSGLQNIEKSNLVIDDAEQWEGLKNKMNYINNVTSSFKGINIDFSEEMIIAVITEVKPVLWEIEIDSIIENSKSINAHCTETEYMA